METVFEVTVTGKHRRRGTEESKTYLIDLGQAAGVDGEDRAKHQARSKAYSDGISPQYTTARKASDYVRCPHCDEPIQSEKVDSGGETRADGEERYQQ